MKQIYLKTLVLLLGIMMGVGSAWGDTETYSLTPNQATTGSTSTSYVTSLTSFTANNVTWSMNQWNPNSLQVKTNQSSATSEFRFYNTSAFPGKITKVVITFSALTLASTTTSGMMFLGGSSSVTATTGGTNGVYDSTNKTITWEPASTDEFTYFAFYQNGKVATGTNKLATADAIVVTYEKAETSKTSTTTTFPESAYTAYIGGEAFTAPTATVDNDGTVTYSSSAESVATVDASTGAVTLVAPGTATIKASYAGDDTYEASSASYTLTVGKVYASLADLVADGTPTTAGIPVKVTLTDEKIQSIYTTTSKDGTTTYRNGIYLTSGSQSVEIYCQNVPDTWEANGTVSGTVTGTWKIYNSTWEICPSDWTELSYTAPAKANQAITLGTYKTAMTTADAADSYTATTDGDGALSVESSNTAVATATISEGTVTITPVAAGTTTITVTAAATDNCNKGSKTYTLKVTEPAKAAELPFSYEGNETTTPQGVTSTGLGSYKSAPYLKFDSTGDELVIWYGADAGKLTYTIAGNSFSDGTFDVMESVDGTEYTSVKSYTTLGDAATETATLNATSRYVKFVYTTKSSGNVALGTISIAEAGAKEDPKLAFENTSYTFDTTNGGTVKAASAAGSTGAITYALTEGDADHFLIDESTGYITSDAVGTYTVTATIAATTDYTESTATCTVKIIEPIVANSIIVATTTDGKAFAMTNTAADKYITSVEIAKAGNKYLVSEEVLETIKFKTTTTEGETTIVAMNGQYLQATAAKNVSFTDDEYLWANAEGVLTAADNSYGTLQYNVSSPRFTTYTNKVGQYATIVSLDDVTTEGYTRTVTADRYGTICLPNAVAEGEYSGATFYTAKINGDNVELTETSSLEAGKPYIYKSSATTVACAYTGEAVTKPVAALPLVGTFTEVIVDANTPGTNYVLQDQGEGQMFYQITSESGEIKVPANKAYLTTTATSVKALRITFGEETAISAVNALVNGEAKIYDINGRRLNSLQKGINIVNGVKVLVK